MRLAAQRMLLGDHQTRPGFEDDSPYGELLQRAKQFLRNGSGIVDPELRDFLLCGGNPAGWEPLQRMPRLIRDLWFDFLMAGGWKWRS